MFNAMTWLVVALGAALVLWVTLAARDRRRYAAESLRLQQNTSLQLAGAQLTGVRIYDRSLGALQLLRSGGRAGVLARSERQLRLGCFGADGNVLVRDLLLAETSVRRWPALELSFGIPATLELIHPRGHVHLAVVNALGQLLPLANDDLLEWLRPRVREVLPAAGKPSMALQKAALFLPLLLAVGGVYFMLHLPRADSGPIVAATRADGTVAAASERRLYLLGAKGDLLQRELTALGLTGPITQLAFGPQGDLYLADRGSRFVRHCDADLRNCPVLKGLDAVGFTGTFRFAFTPDGKALMAADNQSGNLVLIRVDGERIASWQQPYTELCMPNGLAFGRDGDLYVADSDHLRITEYSLTGRDLEIIRHYDMRDEPAHRCLFGADNLAPIRSLPGVRPDRGRPVALAQDSRGRWWVTLSNMVHDPAEIVLFDENWKQPRPLALAQPVDSLSLQPLGEDMLVADTGRQGLLWVATGDLSTRTHGNAAFDAAMAQSTLERLRASALQVLTVFLAMAPLLLALLLSWRRTQAALRRMS